MKKASLLVLGIVLVIAFLWQAYRQNSESGQMHITGLTMGTIAYNVKYSGNSNDLQSEIDGVLAEFNRSLSTYIPDSEISRLNASGHFDFESRYFLPVLKTSREIFLKTTGAFDPSVGPLVQAWGFGPDKEIPKMDQILVDSLKSVIGFNRVVFNDRSVSLPKNFQLDFSAIAKGYAVDLVAELLEVENIENYMVEIGGEVRSKGLNEKQETWTLGIEDPTVNQNERRLYAIARLKDRSLATSGNYRNYYKKDGRIYAHIIDPRTGYNATHDLLSVSVFAKDCMTADAYATAFMVLGTENSMKIVESESELDAVFIYQNEKGSLESQISSGIKPFAEIR